MLNESMLKSPATTRTSLVRGPLASSGMLEMRRVPCSADPGEVWAVNTLIVRPALSRIRV